MEPGFKFLAVDEIFAYGKLSLLKVQRISEDPRFSARAMRDTAAMPLSIFVRLLKSKLMFKFNSFESCRSHPSIDHDSRIQSMVQTYRQKIFYSVFGPYRGSAMDQRKGVKIAT